MSFFVFIYIFLKGLDRHCVHHKDIRIRHIKRKQRLNTVKRRRGCQKRHPLWGIEWTFKFLKKIDLLIIRNL